WRPISAAICPSNLLSCAVAAPAEHSRRIPTIEITAFLSPMAHPSEDRGVLANSRCAKPVPGNTSGFPSKIAPRALDGTLGWTAAGDTLDWRLTVGDCRLLL